MGSRGPRSGAQRSKSSKVSGATKKKRFKNDNPEAQGRYHAAIAARRAKSKARKHRKG